MKQESVWNYPRPPRVELISHHVQVIFNGTILAESRATYRVLETSHPPVYYIPPADIQLQYLTESTKHSWCEFKGQASYYDIRIGAASASNAAWFYPQPSSGFRAIAQYVAFYPTLMDACFVDGERVQPQPGGFYGGWITRNIIGPFKGGLGSAGYEL